jgi:outer membrane protein with beta-barrel domain
MRRGGPVARAPFATARIYHARIAGPHFTEVVTNARVPAGLLSLLLAGAVRAGAQEPSVPPPPAGGSGDTGAYHHELLPDIGLIGAQVGISGGVAWTPFEVGQGAHAGGYVDLPLARLGSGKLSYEISVALSLATSPEFQITDQVAYVANLATGASNADALAGPPAAPFPVRRRVRTDLRLLQVSPFALKYTVRRFDAARLRPYVAAGLDIAVTITHQDPVDDESLVFNGTAPFDAPLIAGQLAQAPELAERGYPTGQGNIDLGFHAAGGLEIRLARRASLNAEYRFTSIGGDAQLHAVTTSLGLHW